MLLLNIDYIPGPARELEALGIVKGTVVYTAMLTEARQIATKRMVDEAEALGADAVLNIRYASASIAQGAAEITAYGTAVRYK